MFSEPIDLMSSIKEYDNNEQFRGALIEAIHFAFYGKEGKYDPAWIFDGLMLRKEEEESPLPDRNKIINKHYEFKTILDILSDMSFKEIKRLQERVIINNYPNRDFYEDSKMSN